MLTECGFSSFRDLGCWSGVFGAGFFFFVHFPQIIYNFKRKSTEGFSSLAVLLRIVGLSFHVFNSLVQNLEFQYVLTGILLLIENFVYVLQFIVYRKKKSYLFAIFLVFPALFLAVFYPETVESTNWINSFTQIVGYIPYLALCIIHGTTKGISMFGQHLNYCGSVCGIIMCSISCNCSSTTWSFYVISLFQSLSVFLLGLMYEEYRFLDKEADKSIPDVMTLMELNPK